MKKRYYLLAVGVLLVSVLTGCGAKDKTEAKTEAKGTQATGEVLTVGFDQNFPPMGFKGDDGKYTGFDLELAAETAKRLNMQVKYQPIEWDAKDMELNSGTISCIWNGFTMTGRENNYTWSMPYMKNKQVYVVKADSGINSAADLNGKIVEVQADSSAEAALKEQPDTVAKFSKFQTTPDYNTGFQDLEMGSVDAVAMDTVVASYQLKKRSDNQFKILDDTISSEEYGIGFKKGNEELKNKVDGALKEMAADGTMKKISEKWFGEDVTIVGK